MVFILSALSWKRIRGLCKFPDARDWLWGRIWLAVGKSFANLVLVGKAMLSKSLNQFTADGWAHVTGRVTATSSKRIYASTPCLPGLLQLSAPDPTAGHCWPMPPPKTPSHSQASLAQSLVGTLLLSPGSWCTQGFVCALWETLFPQSCTSSVIKSQWPSKSLSLRLLLFLGLAFTNVSS